MSDMVPNPGDIVTVTKKSRGRFFGRTADKGMSYYVLRIWHNSYGSLKLQLLDKQGNIFYTTHTCASVTERSEQAEEEYRESLEIWRSRTFVPVFLIAVPGYNGKIAKSITKASILVRGFNQDNAAIWLSKTNCHPEDWAAVFNLVPDQAVTARVPEWFARKNKLMG